MSIRIKLLFMTIAFASTLTGLIIIVTTRKGLNLVNTNGKIISNNIVETKTCDICITRINSFEKTENNTLRRNLHTCYKKQTTNCYNTYVLLETDNGNCAANIFEYELELTTALDTTYNMYKIGNTFPIYKSDDNVNINDLQDDVTKCYINTESLESSRDYSKKNMQFGYIVLALGSFLLLICCCSPCFAVKKINPSININIRVADACNNLDKTPDTTPNTSPQMLPEPGSLEMIEQPLPPPQQDTHQTIENPIYSMSKYNY